MMSDEKCGDKSVGMRVNNLFQLLERAMAVKTGRRQTQEELSQTKYATTKLYQLLAAQDKLHRDYVLKQQGHLSILMHALEHTTDECVLVNIINILHELMGKAHTSKRASMLVSHGATKVLFSILKTSTSQDCNYSEELLLLAHSLLARIAHRDRKFAVKARLHKCLLVTLNLIRNHVSNFRVLQYLLQVFKHYTMNSVNASYLGKHSSINIIFRVMNHCGKKHITVLKLALDNFNNLTKSKSNAARTIGMGGIPTILSMYTEWHQTDTKNRHVSLRKAILHTLKNITNLKSGRKAFVAAGGIRILYETSQEVVDCREMESLILLASVIMRKCCPRNRLPLSGVQSSVSFPLPMSEFHRPECLAATSQGSLSSLQSADESDQSSLDDDDDIDSDDERFRTDNVEEPDEDPNDLEPQEVRTPEDLRMYDKFFPELFEYEIKDFRRSVVIPTANSDPAFVDVEDGETMRDVVSGRRVRSSSCLSDLLTRRCVLGPTFPLAREGDSALYGLNEQLRQLDREREGRVSLDCVNAVNLKTGTSVFSLDPQSPSSSKSLGKTSSAVQRGNGKKAKAMKKSALLLSKDKKLRKPSRASEGDLAETLCITPLVTPREFLDTSDRTLSSSSEERPEEEESELIHDPRIYTQLAAETRSVYRFEKLAFPDLYGATALPQSEALASRKFGVQRSKVFEDIDRMIHPESVIDRVVYDLDGTIQRARESYTSANSNLSNRDELRAGRQGMGSNVLHFNAQFECGNLRKVIQVREYEYDLILNPDINANHHHQWFYFEVSNMLADVPYRFNIVNCEKPNSQFNFGMKPVMFSVMDAMDGKGHWKRVGYNICYYKNHFIRSSQTTGGAKGKSYYTATFTIKFQHSWDICYLAYHYPYSYTTLKTHLNQWEAQCDYTKVYLRVQSLCETLGGNTVPVLTITAQPKSLEKDRLEEFHSRPYVFLSSRVHPGESNASWVMKGTIDFLLSQKPAAQNLREQFIFKVVPMLNPDGVINGHHRCSLVAEDLNRRWLRPCPTLHPTIYHTKGLLQYLHMINKVPFVFCDYHGHSRRKNIFMYGCAPSMSWIMNDTRNPNCTGNKAEDSGYRTLPRILHLISPPFSISNCSFVVERAKEATARVVVWREISVVRSYTMESSYCGCDQGKYKELHISTQMLEEMGAKFCEGLIRLSKTTKSSEQLPTFNHLADLASDSGDPTASTITDNSCLDDSDEEDGGSLLLGRQHHGQRAVGAASVLSDLDLNLSESEEDFRDDDDDDDDGF